ncbi:hypothetical protein EDB82DRAFT_499011 [Fusarium venenatum]|uniref:uncharacterized protein n=1 Tax=Fusarium venenatum TaxID=56646 RepID=UPI001DBFA913|nr:hypothetical protein EDB82DRAFT_499011 [Fusarium venenatum]
MTSPTPLKDILDQSQVEPMVSVADLEKTLKECGFTADLESWAIATSAGAAHYAVGISNNPFKPVAQGQIIVKVYCEKTPKLVPVPKWKTSSNSLRWQYQPSTVPSQTVNVVIRADDTTKLEMLVGACLKPGIRIPFSDKPKIGRVTLGLVFRHNKDLWAITVAHSFETEGVEVTHESKDYFVLECKLGANGSQCEPCSENRCVEGCTLEKAQVMAQGRGQIYRAINRLVFDLAIVNISTPLSSPVKPLDVTEFIELFKKIGGDDPVYNKTLLDMAKRSKSAIDNFRGVSQRYASSSFLQKVAADPDHNSLLMFKKGMNTNWTWGLLAEANEKEFSVVSPVPTGKTPTISELGDCGSTWFIFDLEYKTAVPVGYHQGRDSAQLDIGDDSFDLAYGQPYHTAFSQTSTVSGPETISQISGFETDDININFSLCFTPIAQSRS